MLTNEFQGIPLSRLGFGTMRLPVVNGVATDIDEKQVDDMIDYAISHGINYFDTAHPYHGGMSEKVIGKSLSRYPRESFTLATKLNTRVAKSEAQAKAQFQASLERTGAGYFDYYLLHALQAPFKALCRRREERRR